MWGSVFRPCFCSFVDLAWLGLAERMETDREGKRCDDAEGWWGMWEVGWK